MPQSEDEVLQQVITSTGLYFPLRAEEEEEEAGKSFKLTLIKTVLTGGKKLKQVTHLRLKTASIHCFDEATIIMRRFKFNWVNSTLLYISSVMSSESQCFKHP